MPRIYIAGPMTGLPDWNFPAFDAAEKEWAELGWEVINPANAFDRDTTLPYKAYVEKDIDDLIACDAIAMLPGWDGPNARGSVWERAVSKRLLGLDVFDADKPFAAHRYDMGLYE